MRISKAVGYALTASIAFTMLVERSGGASPVVSTSLAHPGARSQSVRQQAFQTGRFNRFLAMQGGIVPGHAVTTPSFMDRSALSKPLVFIANAGGTAVGIYLQAGKNKMVGQVTGFTYAADVATDVAGDLYVTDLIAANDYGNVTVFAPPYTNGPKLTLYPGTPQLGIAVSSQGVVAVPACTGSQCGPDVVFYAPGSTTPCATVVLDESIFAGGLGWAAFDGKGSLYVEGATSHTLNNPIIIAKIDGGCNARKYRKLTLGNAIAENSAGGIKIDKTGRIAIVDSLSSNSVQIDTYDPPKGGSLGNPVSTTALVGFPNGGPLAFLASGRRVWVGNSGSSNSPTASEYAYPAGGAPEKSISVSPPNEITAGVAVTPPLVP
jgi:hypothetical protein